MTDLDLWFPEDFDKRYAKYLEKHTERKMPEPFFSERLENERKHLLSITSEEDFQHEIEKWRPLKVIVDAIYKDLSPFLPGDAQVIKIDPSNLGLQEKQASHILMMLAYERICRWKIDNSSAVISTEALSDYLGGSGIVISDYEKFQEFRNKINDFYKFMEDQRDQKFFTINPPGISVDFPNVRQAQTKALEVVLGKGLEKEALKEEIVGEIKRAGVWGGGVVSDLPLIEYSEVTGKGEVVGKKKFKFKDGSPEYNVFKMLYAKLGKKPAKLERLEVLVAGNFYEDHQQELDPSRKTAETALINDITKNIREKTGLNTDELVNNGGNLTLLAMRQDKNPPKVTKFVPVWG